MYILHKPEAAKRVTLPGEKIRDAQLDFNLADVNAARQGDDLVLSFEDGAQLVFTNYFQIHDGNLPELNFADGLKHLGPDDFRSDWERPHDKAEAAPGTREGGMDGADASGRLAGVSADSGQPAGSVRPVHAAFARAGCGLGFVVRAFPVRTEVVRSQMFQAVSKIQLG